MTNDERNAVKFVHYSAQANDYQPCTSTPSNCKFSTHHSVRDDETPEETIERIHVSNVGSAAGMGTKARRRPDDYLGLSVDKWGLKEKDLPGIKEAWNRRFGRLKESSSQDHSVSPSQSFKPGSSEEDQVMGATQTSELSWEQQIEQLKAEQEQYKTGERPPWHVLADDYNETTRLHESVQQSGADSEDAHAQRVEKAEAQVRIAKNLYESVAGIDEMKEYWGKVSKLPVQDENGNYYTKNDVEKIVRKHSAYKQVVDTFKEAYSEAEALPESSKLKQLLLGSASQSEQPSEQPTGSTDGTQQAAQAQSQERAPRYAIHKDLETAKEKEEQSRMSREKILRRVRKYYEAAIVAAETASEAKSQFEQNYQNWLYAGWPHDDREPPKRTAIR